MRQIRRVASLLGAMILVMGIPATFAQGDQHLAGAVRLIEVTGAAALVQQMTPAIMTQQTLFLRQARPDLPEPKLLTFQSELQAEMAASMPDFVSRMAAVYAEHFTAAEIEQLTAFYSTPLGRKSLMAMPAIMQKSLALGDAWSKEVGARVRQRFESGTP